MKILIIGLAKSGTTALFYQVMHALSSSSIGLFEPHSYDRRMIFKAGAKALLTSGRLPHIVAKVLAFEPGSTSCLDSFFHFEKQILIARDPRDRLVSHLLYGIYNSRFVRNDPQVGTFLAMLKDKESEPLSLPLTSILQTYRRLNGDNPSTETWAAEYAQHSIDAPLRFESDHPATLLFKYEDMIDGRLEHVDDYLGLSLESDVAVSAARSRVARTKGYGNWRDWLTPEDVDVLTPIMQPYLDRYYPQADWQLNPCPMISADHGSRYVERIVNHKRAALKLPPFSVPAGA